jgi:hypothetical protein
MASADSCARLQPSAARRLQVQIGNKVDAPRLAAAPPEEQSCGDLKNQSCDDVTQPENDNGSSEPAARAALQRGRRPAGAPCSCVTCAVDLNERWIQSFEQVRTCANKNATTACFQQAVILKRFASREAANNGLARDGKQGPPREAVVPSGSRKAAQGDQITGPRPCRSPRRRKARRRGSPCGWCAPS